MRKRFRVLCAVLMMSIFTGIFPAYAAPSYSDVYEYDAYRNAVERLGNLEIINGYTDGTFRPGDTLTRAQFAKIVVCAMDKEDEASAGGISSSFYDIPQGYWATPYINYVSQNNMIIGYADGSFRPEQSISYAEAVTVLLRMLDYTEADVGYYWPENYMAKAKGLKITDNFTSIGANDSINRAVAAVLTDAAIFTEINPNPKAAGNDAQTSGSAAGTSSSRKDTTFLESVGYTVLKDSIVLSTANDDPNMPAGNIKLSDNNTYASKTNDWFQSASFLKYTVLDDDNFIVAVKDNLSGDAAAQEMEKKGYTVLANCHIIASSAEDRNLASGEVRTSAGVYSVQNSDIASYVGEVGTVILNKDKKIISAGTHEAPNQEYIISEVNNANIEYVTNNTVENLALADNFPIYIDYGTKKDFSAVKSDFVAGAELTMYRSGDSGDWEFGVLDKNAGYSILNDCFIIATKNEDKTLTSDQVRTSSGTYKVDTTEVLANAGTMGTVVVNSTGKIEQFAPTNMQSLDTVVNKLTNDEVEYTYAGGGKGSFKFDSTFVTYVDYEKTTYAQAKSYINSGTDITFYGTKQGEWEFAVIDDNSDITPVLATRNYTDEDTSLEGTPIDKNNLTVYRAGESASLSDIQRNDVVYYNTKTNTMDVYNKKVTGIYYDAQPSKAYVTSVTVGGKAYDIGSTTATAKLDASSGSYAIGDKITLLLGKNDKVEFVVELTDFDYFDYGVVLNTYSSIKESGDNAGKSEIKAKVFMPDGSEYEYVTDKDYASYKGALVKLTYANGVVSMSRVSTNSKVYGDIDKINRTIDGKTLLKDASIMQLISNEDGQDAEVQLLNFDTLDVEQATYSQVLSTITANKFGDIGILYVENLTKDGYDFPMLVSVQTNNSGNSYSNREYKLYMDGAAQTYTSETKYPVRADVPVGVKLSNGKIIDMITLYEYKSANSIDAVEGGRIMLNGKVYNMAADVKIYSEKNNKYSELSLDELEELKDINSVSIFSDKKEADNGVVRAILITRKS